jgi:hypothetical protein
MEIANEADLRTSIPRKKKPDSQEGFVIKKPFRIKHDPSTPAPGVILSRKYKGREIRVLTLPDGFEYEVEKCKSLTALVEKITGAHWNGYDFFKLNRKGKKNGKK